MTQQLVDFWSRPYLEAECLDHNQRVREGAPYAELLTVDDMNARYRLLTKPRRVFDLTTGRTWSPGEFRGIYTASNVRIGRKRVPVSQLWITEAAALGGVWFHSVNEKGEIEWQGQVLSDKRSVYTVQLYNWVLGDEEGDRLEVDGRSTKDWRWYGSAEEMRGAYERMEAQCAGTVVLAG